MAKNNAITGWMTPEDAADYIFNAIKSGEYLDGELKKSSYKFTNGKNKDDGYMCKVIAINGAIRREPTNKNIANVKIIDGLIVPEKKAVPNPNLSQEWVDEIDKLDIFDLEEEFADRQEIAINTNVVSLINKLMIECEYIKARIADHESVLDPEVVQQIHEIDALCNIRTA